MSGKRKPRFPRKPYQKPQLKKHNDVVKSVQGFSGMVGPTGPPPAAAQSSPVAPAATVF